jgi:hypothetical protein
MRLLAIRKALLLYGMPDRFLCDSTGTSRAGEQARVGGRFWMSAYAGTSKPHPKVRNVVLGHYYIFRLLGSVLFVNTRYLRTSMVRHTT